VEKDLEKAKDKTEEVGKEVEDDVVKSE